MIVNKILAYLAQLLSFREKVALRYDRVIRRDRSLDWLPILEIAIPRVIEQGGILTIEDLKNLRRTCKLVKQLVEPGFTKLEIDFDTLDDDDYALIAASPLLEHIRELEFVCFQDDEDYIGMDPFEVWDDHHVPLSTILERCSLNLERLRVLTTEDPDFSLSRYSMALKYRFPKLKSLSLRALKEDTLKIYPTSLFSMTSLDELHLPELIDNCDGFISLEDLEILNNAPFLSNLAKLTLCVAHYYLEDQCQSPFAGFSSGYPQITEL